MPQIPAANFDHFYLGKRGLATKFTSIVYNNAYWATLGGVPLGHLNELEVTALQALGGALHARPEALRA